LKVTQKLTKYKNHSKAWGGVSGFFWRNWLLPEETAETLSRFYFCNTKT